MINIIVRQPANDIELQLSVQDESRGDYTGWNIVIPLGDSIFMYEKGSRWIMNAPHRNISNEFLQAIGQSINWAIRTQVAPKITDKTI